MKCKICKEHNSYLENHFDDYKYIGLVCLDCKLNRPKIATWNFTQKMAYCNILALLYAANMIGDNELKAAIKKLKVS